MGLSITASGASTYNVWAESKKADAPATETSGDRSARDIGLSASAQALIQADLSKMTSTVVVHVANGVGAQPITASGEMSYGSWVENNELSYMLPTTAERAPKATSETTAMESFGGGASQSAGLSVSTKEYDLSRSDAVMLHVPGGWVAAANEMVNGVDTGYGPDAVTGDYQQEVDVSTVSLSALYTAAGKSADEKSDTETASLITQFVQQSSGSQDPVAWKEEPDGTVEFATFSSSFTPNGSAATADSTSESDGTAGSAASATAVLDPVATKRADQNNLIDQLFQISDEKHKPGDKSKLDLT
ncbi:conserved hypothetical protein [Gluconacetobacter diazotrophicus PA1 5]|nr:conserved hypothetical protein [Gluconacetobacter diazotrophicus PA1 5]TWB07820.1 hypothetical protein FBZ86_10910 [Gluconacetobacter diazotrophicus]